jgi:hypothetical protein
LPASLLRNHERCCPVGLLIVLLQFGSLRAQPAPELPAPPDFDQSAITAAAEALSGAWAKWRGVDAGLEQRVFRIPVPEARQTVQRAFDGYLGVLDKRRAYSDAVSAYIDQSRAEPRPRQVVVTLGAVFEDHVQLLGCNLKVLEEKMGALRDAPQWISIRRGVRDESAEAFQLQSARRSAVPVDLSLRRSPPASPISSLLYRDSERQVADVLRRLWTRYYQTLVDAAEPGHPPRPLRTSILVGQDGILRADCQSAQSIQPEIIGYAAAFRFRLDHEFQARLAVSLGHACEGFAGGVGSDRGAP